MYVKQCSTVTPIF